MSDVPAAIAYPLIAFWMIAALVSHVACRRALKLVDDSMKVSDKWHALFIKAVRQYDPDTYSSIAGHHSRTGVPMPDLSILKNDGNVI